MSITEEHEALTEVIEWRPWPRDTRYIVGEDGTVVGPRGVRRKHVQKGRAAISYIDPATGYSRVKVAIIVCETYHGPKPDPAMHAAHEDGNSLNDRASNLAWKTPKQNNADKLRHGTWQGGERATLARLTDHGVREMRRRWAQGETFADLGRAFDVDEVTASRAVRGITWGHVQ